MAKRNSKDVVVIGGGMAGMQSALLLAEKGHRVHVLDSAPAIGGFFPLLDRQFPTNSCGVCFMSPKPPAYCPIYESEFHENIDIVTNCAVTGVTGEAGNFELTCVEAPRYVDINKCTLCGKCSEVCPEQTDSELGGGLEKRKAVYLPFPQAIPRTFVIDEKTCTKCGECVKVCSPGAISLEQKSREVKLQAGAIVLGFGFEPFQARLKGEFGAGRYPNVLSSIQYERMLSFSGPSAGLPQRPSDGEKAKKVAFIQCVGSRDMANGREYCSSVCCMYATKQAMVSKERIGGLDAAIFYMDIRAMGKDYERYYEQAKSERGVRFVRSAISSVRELKQSNNLLIAYGLDNGEIKEEEFDIVVLSVGFTPPQRVTQVAQSLGIELDQYGFCRTDEFSPSATTVPGIYVAGAFREPRDIPETVVDASAAAADVGTLLDRFDERPAAEEQTASPRPLSPDVEPRIGVFLCDNKNLLAEKLDTEAIVSRIAEESDVVCAVRVDVTSVEEGLKAICESVGEKDATHVVLAGYRRRELSRALQKDCPSVGTAPGRIDFANIGEQCADVHGDDKEQATAKAQNLVRSIVRKMRRAQPRTLGRKALHSHTLVVGGGVSGLTSSLCLADQGMKVTLVEKTDKLGGNALEAHRTLKGSDVRQMVDELAKRAESHPDIEILKGTQLKSCEGTWGAYHSVVQNGGDARQIDHGALIIASGGHEMASDEYLNVKHPSVVTQRTFEGLLVKNDSRVAQARTIVMIQCVGSRDENHPYCSRVCCGHAVRNALGIKQRNPEVSVYVLNRDVRTYGFYEKKYQDARDKGVVFVRYDVSDKPQVSESGDGLSVSFTDPIVGERIELKPDFVVLSVGIEPNDNAELAQAAGVELNADGFFAEANPKAAPLDSVDRGKYFAGLCHSPNHFEDAIAQGKAAAARVSSLLWQGEAEYADNQAYVNRRLCSGCGLCIEACPYHARIMDGVTSTASVREDLCKGCGTCVISCPNGASQQYDYERGSMFDVLDEVLE